MFFYFPYVFFYIVFKIVVFVVILLPILRGGVLLTLGSLLYSFAQLDAVFSPPMFCCHHAESIFLSVLSVVFICAVTLLLAPQLCAFQSLRISIAAWSKTPFG